MSCLIQGARARGTPVVVASKVGDCTQKLLDSTEEEIVRPSYKFEVQETSCNIVRGTAPFCRPRVSRWRSLFMLTAGVQSVCAWNSVRGSRHGEGFNVCRCLPLPIIFVSPVPLFYFMDKNVQFVHRVKAVDTEHGSTGIRHIERRWRRD